MGKIFFLLPRLALAGFCMFLLLMMFLGNFDAFEPYLYPLHLAQAPNSVHGRIVVGHYPSATELRTLRRKMGTQVDISLLDPQLPQERALNLQLEKNVRALGMEFKSYPLNYLDLNGLRNRETVAQIARYVASNPQKRVFIHCYLGRHRAALVRNELQRLGLLSGQ
jgi:hypothetical protein